MSRAGTSRCRVARAFARLAACALFLAAGTVPALALEYRVKATYLYKLAEFIEWPDASFASPSAPLEICVVGINPFDAVLATAAWARQIRSHPVVVRHLPEMDDTVACHVMYIAGSPQEPVAEILERVRGKPVLSVTDDANDPGSKGVVHFVLYDNKVRFEIDDALAAQAGLRINARVLGLAVSVNPRPGTR